MRRALFILFFFAVCPLLDRTDAYAQRISLTNLVVDNQGGRIKVRFGTDIKAPAQVDQALASGQVLALECRASLARKREYAWNAPVASAESLSPLTMSEAGSYEIIPPAGQAGHMERYRGRDLGLVIKEAWGAMSLDLGDWNRLEPGNVYSLTLEIRVVRQDVSSWLQGALFFWNFDALPPVKYQLDFSY